MVRFTIVNCLPALLLPLLSICLAPAAQESYDLAFSTYLGGSNWEHARDIAADAQGNIYVWSAVQLLRTFPRRLALIKERCVRVARRTLAHVMCSWPNLAPAVP